MTCRICHEEGNTTCVCNCKGTHGQVHIKCVQKWIEHSGKIECEICQSEYYQKVTAESFNDIYTMGFLTTAVHAYVMLSLIEYSVEKKLFYSFIFGLIQILLWLSLYKKDNKYSITYVVAWTIIYFVASTFLQLSYQIKYEHLIYDYSLTLFLAMCCCIQSIRKKESQIT